MPILREFQIAGRDAIYDAWGSGNRNVLAVYPTGSGKTVLFSEIVAAHTGASCVIAHRQELVGQISLALARNGVRHRIVGPKKIVTMVVNLHLSELNKSFYDPTAPCAVAGVDTLIRRGQQLDAWLKTVTLWVMDEAHHLLRANKWGKAVSMFVNAKRGLGVTATTLRADGKGLGRRADGVIDKMIVGPMPRDLIRDGYLTDYRVFVPPSDLILDDVSISTTTGDYKPKPLSIAVDKSHIVGDIVTHYKRLANGKLGITFATSVASATAIVDQFNSDGVPAALVTANTPNAERAGVIKRFRNREILQLVNVDIFGEGFDLPAIEVVSMARPTASYGLYTQQFGRALRIMLTDNLLLHWDDYTIEQRRNLIRDSIKPHAIIIDHTGNVIKHGLPDVFDSHSLAGRERRGGESLNLEPLRACGSCSQVYKRSLRTCPACGFTPTVQLRSDPKQVEGDLTELDADTLATMRGEIDRVDLDAKIYNDELEAKHAPRMGRIAHVKRHIRRQKIQKRLRNTIAWWAGWQRSLGNTKSASYRRFNNKFGYNVMGAQVLNEAQAEGLIEEMLNDFK